MLTKWLAVAVVPVTLAVAGCGIDWFPDDSKTFTNNSTSHTPFPNQSSAHNATAPNAFTFTPNTLKLLSLTDGTGTGTSDSNTVTITGDNQNGWTGTAKTTASTTTASSTLILINGTAFFEGATLDVKPGDTLQISQSPNISTPGTYSTKIVLGTYSTSFRTTVTF